MPSHNQNRIFENTQVIYAGDQISAMSEEYIPGMFLNFQLPQQNQVQREQTTNGESGDDISELSEHFDDQLSEADFDDEQREAEDFRTCSSTSDDVEFPSYC